MKKKNKKNKEKKYYFPRLIITLFIITCSLVSYYLLLLFGFTASEQGGYVTIAFDNYGEMYGEIIQFSLIFIFILIGGSFLIYMGFKELRYDNI